MKLFEATFSYELITHACSVIVIKLNKGWYRHFVTPCTIPFYFGGNYEFKRFIY